MTFRPYPKTKKKKSTQEDYGLWKVFSQYIRMRDAYNFSKGEIAACITCGYQAHWKKLQCGHFISRNHKSVKYNELNNNVQCPACNGPKSGMQYEYGRKIDHLYGKGTAEKLSVFSKQPVKDKLNEVFCKELKKYYQEKIKQLQLCQQKL
jgi:hypothetical protein